MEDNPLPQWTEELLGLALAVSLGFKRTAALITGHAYYKFVMLTILPTCVGFGALPTICQAQPTDPHQPLVQVQSNGTAGGDLQTASGSAGGDAPKLGPPRENNSITLGTGILRATGYEPEIIQVNKSRLQGVNLILTA